MAIFSVTTAVTMSKNYQLCTPAALVNSIMIHCGFIKGHPFYKTHVIVRRSASRYDPDEGIRTSFIYAKLRTSTSHPLSLPQLVNLATVPKVGSVR